MIRWKTIPWVLGVALVAFSLVAARLLNADTPVNGAGANPLTPPPVGGLTVLGVVDSSPSVARIDAPGVMGMPAVTVSKVHVKAGDRVQPGDLLVEFDASSVRHKLAQAEQELIAAQWEVELARLAHDDWETKRKLQQIAVEAAESELKFATEALERGRETFERTLSEIKQFQSNAPLTEAQKEQRRRDNLDLLKLEGAVDLLKKKVEKERTDLKRLDASRSDGQGHAMPATAIDIQRASAKVGALQATVAQAKEVIESFQLKAGIAGTVEQLAAVSGMTFSPASRTPLLYIVPVGKRMVYAEVEAEFAHKIESHQGKPVTVCDQHDTTHSYAGTVIRVGGAFLPKRFGGDSLVGGGNRVLECMIEVTDPNPPGKPPLRPGQTVTVRFGP